MDRLTWHTPHSLSELEPLLSLKGARLHGGGTGLLRSRPSSGTLVDLSRIGCDDVTVDGDTVSIGGTTTFADVVDGVSVSDPDHILVKALSTAATPALRNRITVGGSLALFPPWSSIVGPLLATGARVQLAGHTAGEVELSEYLATRDFRQETAVIGVTCSRCTDSVSYWYEFKRTRLTYPLFTVSVVIAVSGGRIDRCRIVLTGTRARFAMPHRLADSLVGTDPRTAQVKESDLETIIPARQGYSSDYLTHLAATAVARGVRAAVGRAE